MKYLITLLIINCLFISCKKEKKLYIFFEKDDSKMYIHHEKLNLDTIFKVFVYKVKTKSNRDKEVFFDSETQEEQNIYVDKNGNYKTKLHQTIIDFDNLKAKEIKNYKWLENKIKSFNSVYDLYKYYNKICIVEVDSIKKRATLTEVSLVEIIE
jgi:hypothetical protein